MPLFTKIILLMPFLMNVATEKRQNHPVHISFVNFEYLEEEKLFSLNVRVFTDDFQAVINKEHNVDISIQESMINKNRKYIDAYIHNHLHIYFNNKKVFTNTSSHSIILNTEENTTEVHYLFKQKVPKKVKLKNTLFFDFFNDQKNLLIFTCENTQEAIKFDRKNTEDEIILR